MRKILLVLCAIMPLLNGCVMIPTGCDTASTETIGKRFDAEGRVCERIVHYDKKLNFVYFGLTSEGLWGSSYFGYSRYAAITGNEKRDIRAMEHFPSLAWTRVKTAIPIPDSDRWITFEENECKKHEWDIYLIVFSVRDGKIVRQRFEHVKRYAPKSSIACWCFIEGNADLGWLRVHETDKITRVNTKTGELVVETEKTPAFR